MNNIAALNCNAKFFREILEEYKRTHNFDNSRIRQDLTKEEAISGDYRGREVFELIQNAEDQNSEYVYIKLNIEDHTLTVSNGGKSCQPFSQSGFSSIMMSDMSPKFISKRSFIGHKGLGFRSLLNWSDEITIISSGVQCTFSREIARNSWDEIKRYLSPELVLAHEEFAKSFRHGCPVAMLSTPHVTNASDTEHTTTIIIKYRPECHQSIHEQLRSLSGKALLFLKNIHTISIATDLGSYDIYKETPRRINDNISITHTSDRNHSDQEWCIYHTRGNLNHDKKYEIGIAYDVKRKESGKYIYSFFPTRVPLDKPFVLHATFDLNSSRNAINLSADNDRVQQLIASSLVEFAEYLASLDSACRDKWLYHSFLSVSPDSLPTTADQLTRLIDKAKVFPTVSKGYLPLADTLHYSEKMAGFLHAYTRVYAQLQPLGSHLINGFTEVDIPTQDYDALLGEIFNDLSRNVLSDIPVQDQIYTRVDVISALVGVRNCQPMALLVDRTGSVIEEDAFINVGESIPYLPDDLKINYVSEKLITRLLRRFEIEGDKSRRSLVQLLRSNNCVDVSQLDISAAREKIITYSRHMSADGFRCLMLALFYRIECNPTPDDSINLLFSNERFQILSADNSRVYPSEVVLNSGNSDLPSKWLLLDSIDDWVKYFRRELPDFADRITTSAVADFFCNKVGISRNIPMDYVMLDNHADDYIKTFSSTYNSGKLNLYLSCFYSHNLEYKNKQNHYNRSKIIKSEFLDYLHCQCQYSLSQVIKFIINDPVARQELGNTTLYYLYYSPKPEVVEIGYSLYRLRRHSLFAPLKHYVVSERIYLLNDPDIEQQLNNLAEKPEFALFLIQLGARERVSDLSLSELYDVLRSLPDRHLKSGIQKTYRLLREAINIRRKDADFTPLAQKFAETGNVYARLGNSLTIIPATDAYYWDNDQLPRRILDSKPKLDIGNRVGEDSVKAIFGVRLAKEITVKIDTNTPNPTLTREVDRHLRERIRYILAYRIHNSREIKQDKDKQLIANHIRAIKINIHSMCRYNDDGSLYTMIPGDMISTGKEFHIVSSYSSINDALRNPTFCENITEAICISLKVTSSDMTNCFRRIIKDSIEENRYIADKEISLEEWADVDKALGLSDFEKKLWTTLSARITIDLDRLSISSGASKSAYLRSIIPAIVLPNSVGDIADLPPDDRYHLLRSLDLDDVGFLGDNCLMNYYADAFKSLRSQFDKSFYEYAYKQTLVDEQMSPYDYFDLCHKFSSDHWYSVLIARLASRVIPPEEIYDLFAAAVKDTFDVELDCDITRNSDFTPEIKAEYLQILADYHLDSSNVDQRVMALALFDGYTDEFTKSIQKNVVPVPVAPDHEAPRQQKILEIIDSVAIAKPTAHPVREHISGGGGGGGGYTSDAAKIISGREAEILVRDSMKSKPDRYTYVKGVSRNLDPVNGDDNLHYDIEYKLTGSNVLRYLEVKFMSQDTIYLTADEYKYAHENPDTYDMAIVHNGKVHIVTSPFADNDSHQRLTPHPTVYRLSISLSLRSSDL